MLIPAGPAPTIIISYIGLALLLLRAPSDGNLPQTATGEQVFAREPARSVRRQKHDDIGNIIRPTGATKRRLADGPLFKVGADEAPGHRALGLNHTRIE